MGKTPRPLKIVAYPPVSEWPELAALEAQGHHVTRLMIDLDADLILGPSCWRMMEELRAYLDLAVKAARRAK